MKTSTLKKYKKPSIKMKKISVKFSRNKFDPLLSESHLLASPCWYPY